MYLPTTRLHNNGTQSRAEQMERLSGLVDILIFWRRKMHVSIVQTVPSEIIREVYGYFATPMHLHKPNRFPWFLGQICATWRAIFNSMTSEFWNELGIDLEMHEFYHDHRPLYLRYDLMQLVLRYLLDRTRGHPFSFQLTTQYHYMKEEDEVIIRLLESLVAESPRWREVYVDTCRESYLSILYQAKHRLPLLNTLQLMQLKTGTEPTDDLFEDAPNLTRVELGLLANWRVNWGSLRMLRIRGFFGNDEKLFSVLGQAGRLEKLAISRLLDKTPAPDLILSFPNLKVLTITGFRLLSVLQAPLLEELYVKNFNELELNMSHNIVISFLIRSSCRLRRLGMAGCSAASLTDILQYTPDLVHLNLDNNDDMAMSFGQLKFYRQRDRTPPARHLRSLTIIDFGLSDIEIMELAVLVASRTEGVKASSGATPVEGLRALSIFISDVPNRYNGRVAVETLRKLCAERGVEFTVQLRFDIPYKSIRDW